MTPSAARHPYLDRVRGLAVLIMIEAHVLDSWTFHADRTRTGFGYAMILGGFGAPLFLFLAGVSLVLSAESKLMKTGDFDRAWKAVQRRGWQVFGLAFLFRLQSYILGGGTNPAGLLKVDILNIMGPAIACAASAASFSRSRKVQAALFAGLTIVVAMATPIVRTTPLLGFLPDPVEWYFRPSPGRTNFTLFPWSAFLSAGAIAGLAIVSTPPEKTRRLQLTMASVAIALAGVAYGASYLPSIYERSEFWTSSPTFFFLRAGVILLLLPAAFLWDHGPWRGRISPWSPVQELGRASLFVYWIHVEMVYGFFSRPLRGALPLEGAIVADIAFSAFLLWLVLLKNRLWGARRATPLAGPAQTQATI